MKKSLLILGACIAASSPLAQGQERGGDATKLLEQARTALSGVHAMSYRAEVAGEGGLEVPPVKADVSMAKADAGGWKLYTKGSAGSGAATAPFEVAYDGAEAHSLRESDKVVYQKSPADEAELQVFFSGQNAKHPIAWELVGETPLAAPNGSTYQGVQTIRGAECDVVAVAGKAEAVGETGYRVYLAKSDHLPRRIDRMVGGASAAGGPGTQARSLTMMDVKINGESNGAAYSMAIPDGYAVKTADVAPKKKPAAGLRGGPRRDEEAGPLAAGTPAPDFKLKDASGRLHKLSDYKGKVLVLDFWATWCNPCKMAMPSVQRLHEKFKGKDVEVIGIDVNDNKDPAEYMASQKYTYGLLLNGEAIQDDYHVAGIPSFFVIGPDSKVLWSAVGFDPSHEKHITEVIEKALAEKK